MSDYSTDQGLQQASAAAARALIEHREEIFRDWGVRARREIQKAAELDEPILINTLPAFIDNLAEALSPGHPRKDATDSTNVALEHGSERARMTQYGPDQLLLEYQILREVILEKLSAKVRLSESDHRTIQRSFDSGIREAVLAFSVMQSQLRERFVATLSHDLRNPLGATKMALEIILTTIEDVQDENLRVDLKTLVMRAMNNTRRADRLIQNLLDATFIHAGEEVPLTLADNELMGITHEVISELAARDQQRIQITGQTARGKWDGEALRRVIENLVSNALKYGDSAKPVEISIAVAHQRVMFSIRNQGEEIPPTETGQLFDIFKRAQSATASGKKGWGIGLAFVRAVIETHGGSVAVDSSKERGTTFTLDFPLDATPYQKKKPQGQRKEQP